MSLEDIYEDYQENKAPTIKTQARHSLSFFSYYTIIQFILVVGYMTYINPTVHGFTAGLVLWALIEIIELLALIPIVGAYFQWHYMISVMNSFHYPPSVEYHIVYLSYIIPGIIMTIITTFLLLVGLAGIMSIIFD